ncbi:hypothetical protein ABFT80_27805 [Mesorhizobium sp. SB112]|uniref:hypothetical protein n=1 Tax=Mesorhizobium sp. SB112 TaxID=3151853 RepID=UPI0032635AEA
MADLAQATSNLVEFAVRRLSFAARPFFVLTATFSANSPRSIICSVSSPFPIGDMTLTYLLISLFQLSPCVTLLSQRLADSPTLFTPTKETEDGTQNRFTRGLAGGAPRVAEGGEGSHASSR